MPKYDSDMVAPPPHRCPLCSIRGMRHADAAPGTSRFASETLKLCATFNVHTPVWLAGLFEQLKELGFQLVEAKDDTTEVIPNPEFFVACDAVDRLDRVKLVLSHADVELQIRYEINSGDLQSALPDESPKHLPVSERLCFAHPQTPQVFEPAAEALLASGFRFLCAPRGDVSTFELHFVRGQELHQHGYAKGTPIGVRANLVWHR